MTTVLLNSVGLDSRWILNVSPSMPKSLNEPVHLPFYLILLSHHTSILELSGRSWTISTSSPFFMLSVSATWFSARIFHTSFIALFIAADCGIILAASESMVSIYRWTPITGKISTNPSGPAVLLPALTTIWNAISLLIMTCKAFMITL